MAAFESSDENILSKCRDIHSITLEPVDDTGKRVTILKQYVIRTIPKISTHLNKLQRFLDSIKPGPSTPGLSSPGNSTLSICYPGNEKGSRLCFLVKALQEDIKSWSSRYPGKTALARGATYIEAAHFEVQQVEQAFCNFCDKLQQKKDARPLMLFVVTEPNMGSTTSDPKNQAWHHELFVGKTKLVEGNKRQMKGVSFSADGRPGTTKFDYGERNRSTVTALIPGAEYVPISVILESNIPALRDIGKNGISGTTQCRKWVFRSVSELCKQGLLLNPDADLAVYRYLTARHTAFPGAFAEDWHSEWYEQALQIAPVRSLVKWAI